MKSSRVIRALHGSPQSARAKPFSDPCDALTSTKLRRERSPHNVTVELLGDWAWLDVQFALQDFDAGLIDPLYPSMVSIQGVKLHELTIGCLMGRVIAE